MQINTHIRTDILKDIFYNKKKVELHIARLDLLHPIVSGNKYFKLKYNIENTLTAHKKGIVTFGGAFSNHLAATAYACNKAGLKSLAIVRGEKAHSLSHTLNFCKENGMELQFVSREAYSNKEVLYRHFNTEFPDYYLVPEGGDNEAGEKGCGEILSSIDNASQYSHIICAIGTGTTFKGLVKSTHPQQTIVGIVVLKGADKMEETLTQQLSPQKNFDLIHNYHFGGYAKKTNELLAFMSRFYQQHLIPSDFVYTGKLFFAADNLIQRDYFPGGSKLLCIHSGGLQGNLSLAPGLLNF